MDQVRDNGLGVAVEIAALMAAELGWSHQEGADQVARYRQVVEQTRHWRGEAYAKVQLNPLNGVEIP